MHKNELSKTNGVQEEEEDGTNAEIVSILLSAGLTSPPPSPQPISPPPLQVRRTFSPYAGPSRGKRMPSSRFGGNMDRPCASVPSLKELPDYSRPNSTDPASVPPPPPYRHTPTPSTFLRKSPSLPKIGLHGSIASSMVLAGATLGRGASHDSLCQLSTVLREANDAIIGNDVSGQGKRRHSTQTSEQERDDKEEGLGKEERQPRYGEDGAHQPLSPSPTLPTHHGPPTDPTASCPTDSISHCPHPARHLPPSLPARLRPLPLGLGQLRLLCFGGYAFLLLAMYGISPFFQEDAQSRLGLPSSLVGLTFSLSALTSMLITPLAAHLCQAFGRYRTLFLGYLLALLANVGFALSRTSPALLSFRSAQGLAMGLVAVASMTLLIASAPDIVKEMGLQELVISVTLIIAPILGGAFYEVMTVERTYLALSAPLLGMVVVLGGMLWSVRRMEGRKEEGRKRCAEGGGLKMIVMDREEGNGGVRMWVLDQGGEEGKEEGWQGGKQTAPVSFASIPSLVEREEEGREEEGEEEMGVEWGKGEGRGGRVGKREEGRERESWGFDAGDGIGKRWEVARGGGDGKGGTSVRDAERPGRNNMQVWRHPRVLLIAVAITLTFASQGFLALSFGVHSRNVLGLASGAVGLFYSAFSLPYALMGVVIGPLSRRVASSTLITYGTFLEALGLLLLGPPPSLLPLPSPPSSPPSSLVWSVTLLGMLFLGTGMGLITMPAIDAMRSTLLNPSSLPPSPPPSSQGRQDPRPSSAPPSLPPSSPPGIDEALASVMSFSLSLGAFAGPLLGGLGIEYLPQTPEYRCLGGEGGGKGGGEGGGKGGCVNGYRWTCLVFSMASIAVFLLLIVVGSQEGGREGGRGGGKARSVEEREHGCDGGEEAEEWRGGGRGGRGGGQRGGKGREGFGMEENPLPTEGCAVEV